MLKPVIRVNKISRPKGSKKDFTLGMRVFAMPDGTMEARYRAPKFPAPVIGILVNSQNVEIQLI